MADLCAEVQARLAASGLRAFERDELARLHLFECAQCYAVLQASIDAAREQTAAPAADAAAEGERFHQRLRRKRGRTSPLLIGAAASVIAVATASVLLLPRSANAPRGSARAAEMRSARNKFGLEGPAQQAAQDVTQDEARAQAANAGIAHYMLRREAAAGSWQSPAQPRSPRDVALGNQPMSALGALTGDQTGAAFGFGGLGMRGTGRGAGGVAESAATIKTQPAREFVRAPHVRANARASAAPRAKQGTARKDEKKQADDADRSSRVASVEDERIEPARALLPRRRPAAMPASRAPAPATPAPPASNAAEKLFASYAAIDGVPLLDANGYFENTYVPGDPQMRALQARLSRYDRAALLPASAQGAQLDAAAARNAQPFDPPSHAALSVYLSASERGISAPRRMLVQVGLQATPRYSGRRPAMNIGIVLDLREALDSGQSQSVRALLAAFADARDLGDKLALFAAGPGGGLAVDGDAFRNGPLTVALQNLLARREAPNVSLREAVQRALSNVRGSDDPNAPLGSSEVIVVAPHALGAEVAEIETLAHEGAVSGVPLSAFGVGAQADPSELSRLALAGQGNRRMLVSGADAAPAVERELSAVARVVARAVRLRIRLAAGVHLVRVLGSHPLDAVQVERVHEAENGIDQRLSKNLGIERDRGDDEEGVQIVIPSFYAGDSHVVLLDVIADGAGLIADVTARFKDLIQLGNGIARQSLWLPNLELARGALQRNVWKNLVAYELSQRLGTAGDALGAGLPSRAGTILNDALALLDSLGGVLPELSGDRELSRDRALTAEYAAVLDQATRDPQRAFFVDSLHFASLLKLQPRPEWDARAE